MSKINNVVAIIRNAGERTLPLCQKLIESQVERSNIITITEVPFSSAVRKTYEIGVDFNLPWTMAIDADVLINKLSIQTALDMAVLEPENTFSFNFKSYDKFFTKSRWGGIHLYRTNLLRAALDKFPTQETIRPESAVSEILNEKFGYKNVMCNKVLSLHDYEQWYCDIYRKSYVHAQKHGNSYVTSFFRYWSKMMLQDLDYRVALIGLCHGIAAKDKPIIDIRTLPQNYQDNDFLQGINEKNALDVAAFSPEGDIYKFEKSVFYSFEHPHLSELRDILHSSSPASVLPGLVSYPISKISNRIYSWAKSSGKNNKKSEF